MKTILAAVCAAVLLAVAPAHTQDPTGRALVQMALDTATTTLAASNFTPVGQASFVSVANGASTEVRMQVEAGKGYVIMAMCDENCSDLDLFVLTEQGAPVGHDVEDDDAPLVTYVATANTTLVVRVSMATCSAATCVAGARLYTGDPAAFEQQ